jgi:nicotinate-nucleotide adenylyltransferase
MRLGILGGTFNPIHYGHLRAAEEARFTINLDKVIFMPSGNPPLKTSDLIDASHRYAMTRLATASNIGFVVSDIEIRETEKSYTVNTIQMLREIYPEDELFFILGVDAFLDLPNWRQPETLIGMIDFVVVARHGFDLREIMKSPYIAGHRTQFASGGGTERGLQNIDKASLTSGREVIPVQMTSIGISSTEIRSFLKEGKSIKYLLPETVENYIYKHNLYHENSKIKKQNSK